MSDEPEFRAYIRRKRKMGALLAGVGIVIGIVCHSVFLVILCAACGGFVLIKLARMGD